MVVGVVATRVGRSYLQLEKLQLEKIKSKKKGLCTIPKVKTKNITNESLPVPYVIDQCSRGDRRCG